MRYSLFSSGSGGAGPGDLLPEGRCGDQDRHNRQKAANLSLHVHEVFIFVQIYGFLRINRYIRTMIRISLIIATHNRAQQLIEALESVCGRISRPGGECVVVNNNSADDTRERFAAFAAHCPELNLRMVLNRSRDSRTPATGDFGRPRHRWRPLSTMMNGSIPDFCGPMPRFSIRIPTLRWPAVGSSPSIRGTPGVDVALHRTAHRQSDGFRTRRCVRFLRTDPGGGNMAFRRSVVAKYGGFDPALGRVNGKLAGGEESDFFQRLQRAARRSGTFPTP